MIYIVIFLAVLLVLSLYSLGVKDKECQKLQEENEKIKELISIYMDVTQKEIEALDRIVRKAKEKGYDVDQMHNYDAYYNGLKMDDLAKELSKYSIAAGPAPSFMSAYRHDTQMLNVRDCCCYNPYANINDKNRG